MPDLEIPRDEWSRFCDAYSRQHRGWLATIELDGRGTAGRLQAEPRPLGGVTFDRKGTGAGDIVIFLDGDVDHAMTHTVAHATHLRLEQEAGQDRGLRVESEEGTTLLRFYHPARPDMVDGI